MRKVLLGTTAIVAVGLLASGVAYAQDEEAAPAEEPMAEEMMADDEMMADEAMAEEEMMEEAPAAEGISVGVGGYYNAAIGFADVDNVSSHSPSVGQDIEIIISGSTTLDNGMTVGVQANIEGNKAGDALDERKIYFQGSFGELQIGSIESAPQQMGMVSARGSNLFGVSTPFYTFAAVSATEWDTSLIASSNDGLNEEDNAKIVYFTPSFNGVKLGASYAPSDTEQGHYGGNVENAKAYGGAYKGQTGIAASYTGDFGDSSFSAMVGYETYEADGMCDSAVAITAATPLTDTYILTVKHAILTHAFDQDGTPGLADAAPADSPAGTLSELEMAAAKAKELWAEYDEMGMLLPNPLVTDHDSNAETPDRLIAGTAADELDVRPRTFYTGESTPGAVQNCSPSTLRVGASFSAGAVTVAGTMLEIDRSNAHSQSILDVGLSFDTGAATVGIGWATSSTETAGGGDDEVSRYGIDFSMPLGTGISLDAQVDTGENTPAGTTGTEWTQFMLGTHISF